MVLESCHALGASDGAQAPLADDHTHERALVGMVEFRCIRPRFHCVFRSHLMARDGADVFLYTVSFLQIAGGDAGPAVHDGNRYVVRDGIRDSVLVAGSSWIFWCGVVLDRVGAPCIIQM